MSAATGLVSSDAFPYATRVGDGRPPLTVTAAAANRSVDDLCAALRSDSAWADQQLNEHGALLFEGFDVASAQDFEKLARAIDADLKNEYLGTSPRDGLTDYVFSASELPSFYPIPQHCEMSFTATPPRRVFFCCLREPAPGMGETPLVDFRQVYADMDRAVRTRFEERGIRIVRNYGRSSGASRLNLFQLKPWSDMFLTVDHDQVEAKCREEGFEPTWGPHDTLRLVSTQPVSRKHPATGELVWHNHSQVFHLSAAPGEYKRIFRLRPTFRNFGWWQFARALVATQRRLRSPEDQPMHCTHLDGGEISDRDMEHVRDVIWANMVFRPWHKGDVVAIDNHRVSHGRLPYRGPREIAVCWA